MGISSRPSQVADLLHSERAATEAPVEMIQSSPAKTIFQAACLIHLLVLAGILVSALPAAVDSWTDIGLIVVGIGLGLVASDLASGVVHWLCDTYGSERTPVVGKLFIRLFRVHHDDPINITRTGFIRINGDNSMLAGGFLLVIIGAQALGGGPTRPMAVAFVVSLALAIGFTNMFHKWSHQASPPAFARLMHRLRLAIPPAAHQRHHTAPYRSDYCITFGWLNPVLERTRFFRRLEAFIEALARRGRNRRDARGAEP